MLVNSSPLHLPHSIFHPFCRKGNTTNSPCFKRLVNQDITPWAVTGKEIKPCLKKKIREEHCEYFVYLLEWRSFFLCQQYRNNSSVGESSVNLYKPKKKTISTGGFVRLSLWKKARFAEGGNKKKKNKKFKTTIKQEHNKIK